MDGRWGTGQMAWRWDEWNAYKRSRVRVARGANQFFFPQARATRARAWGAWHARVQRTRLGFFLRPFFFQILFPVLSTLRPFLTRFLSFFRLDRKRKVVVCMEYFPYDQKSKDFVAYLERYSSPKWGKNIWFPFSFFWEIWTKSLSLSQDHSRISLLHYIYLSQFSAKKKKKFWTLSL